MAAHDRPAGPRGDNPRIGRRLGRGPSAKPASGRITTGRGRRSSVEKQRRLAPRRILQHWQQLEEAALHILGWLAGGCGLARPEAGVAVALGLQVQTAAAPARRGRPQADHVAVAQRRHRLTESTGILFRKNEGLFFFAAKAVIHRPWV